jgi:hypothetical protein
LFSIVCTINQLVLLIIAGISADVVFNFHRFSWQIAACLRSIHRKGSQPDNDIQIYFVCLKQPFDLVAMLLSCLLPLFKTVLTDSDSMRLKKAFCLEGKRKQISSLQSSHA